MMMDRRTILASGMGLGAAAFLPAGMAHATVPGDKRLLFILQRGAADGLATLAPLGDPGFVAQRGAMAEDAANGARIDPMFALHPALEQVAGLYTSREALFVHAVASSYRDRSHFDGQNLIESGGASAYSKRDGWMNRLIGLIAAQNGGADPGSGPRALALAPSVPLALQGANSVGSYAPNALPDASDELMERVSSLYSADPMLDALWQEALKTREMAGGTKLRNLRDAQAAGNLAASLMQGADSARIMMVESNGWDSHAGQHGQLNGAFRRLDAMIGAFHFGIGADWANTLVIVATEFGRTVKANGTGGTDHGTASAAMLLGGGVAGGRVVADWPGLADNKLYEGRDLMPTTSLESVITGAVANHFTLDPARALGTLFPGRDSAPLEGLLKS